MGTVGFSNLAQTARHLCEAEDRWRQEQAEARRCVEEQEAAEHAQREEQAQREHEAAERAEAARLAEEQEVRTKAIAGFLKEHGFASAEAPKRSMMKTTYPLHCAAKEGNSQMVEMLLKEGVNPAQKNSSGKTAAQVAQMKNKKGSHASVLLLLNKVAVPNAGGA